MRTAVTLQQSGMVRGGDFARVAKGAGKVAKALLQVEGPAVAQQALRLKEHGGGMATSLKNVSPLVPTMVEILSPCNTNAWYLTFFAKLPTDVHTQLLLQTHKRWRAVAVMFSYL